MLSVALNRAAEAGDWVTLRLNGVMNSPQSLNLTATLLPANPDPNANPATASFSLSLLDNRNPDPLDIPIGNTIEGDQAPLRDANGNIQRDQWGNVIPTGPEPGRQDTINDTPANDRINAGVGDDISQQLPLAA